MDTTHIVERFNSLYLGDSVLQKFVLETAEAQCRLEFNAGKVLGGQGASIFDPVARFEPALLRFNEVKSLCCEGGPYQLNSTVVDFGAARSGNGEYVEFYFDLTGGTNPESFMVKIKIVAGDFEFGAVEP